MPATDRYQLLLETATRGEAELRRFEQSINRLADVAERSQNRTASSYERTSKRASEALKKTGDDARQFGQRIHDFVSRPLSAAGNAFQEFASGGGKMGAALGAVAVGLVGASTAAFGLVKSASGAAREIQNFSDSTGFTINQMDRFMAVAKLSGFSMTNLNQAAVDLSGAIRDTGGQGDKTRKSLRELGISFSDQTGKIRPLNSILLETIDAVSKIDETSQRVRLSTVLGGEDAAARIQTLLKNYQQYNKLAGELGFGTRENVVKPLNEAATEIQKLGLQFDLLRDKLAVPFTFVLREVNEALSSSRQAQRDPRGFLGIPDSELPTYNSADPLTLSRADILRRTPGTPGFYPSTVDAALQRNAARQAAGESLFRNFASGRGGEQSIQFRLARLQEERAVLLNTLGQGTLGESSFNSALAGINRLTAEERSLQESLARLEKARQLPDQLRAFQRAAAESAASPFERLFLERTATLEDFRKSGANASQLRGVSSVFDQKDSAFIADATQRRLADQEKKRLAEEANLLGSDPFLARLTAVAAASDASARNDAARILREQTTARERLLSINQQELEFQIQKLELLAGPGGEAAAVNQIAQLKLAALRQEAELSLDIEEINQRTYKIEQERQIALLQLARRRHQEGREAIGRTFDALISGGSGGLGALVRSVGLSQVRTIAQNAGEGLSSAGGGFLGRIGQASGLGKFLGGTLFDPANAQNPLKTATDQNTVATQQNTAALLGARSTVSGGAGGALSAIAGLIPGFSPSLDKASNAAAGTRNLNTAGLISGLPLNAANKSGFSVGQGVGIAGAGLAGVLGAVNGFKSGGVQGGLTGTASIAGAAGSILALSGVTGPAAPILAGIGLALAATAALIGDPKKNRDRALDRLVSNAAFSETTPMDFAFNTQGGGFDYNKRGDLRATPIMLTIQALDARSILDRGEDIANAVQGAMISGHSINRTAQEVVMGF
jgi:hypothetical protein